MTRARVPAFAKINLHLEVLWRREDGYHDIATVFQTIDLCDWLEIEVSAGEGVEVSASIPIPGVNIAERAATLVLNELQQLARVRIHIEKKIPLGGGLGGSSTDGSAVLLALPALLGVTLPGSVREGLAADLGSDVNFLMRGGTAAAFGRGTQFTPLPDLPRFSGELFAPGFPVDSGAAYRALSRPGILDVPRSEQDAVRARYEKLLSEMQTKPMEVWAPRCANDFEAVVFAQHPELEVRRAQMGETAPLARMSGSGSSLFALRELPAGPHDFETLSRARFVEAWRDSGLSLPEPS